MTNYLIKYDMNNYFTIIKLWNLQLKIHFKINKVKIITHKYKIYIF